MQNTKKINPVSIGIAGAVAGAVGTALVMTLTDEEKKKQLEKKFFQMKKDINTTVNQWSKKAEELKKKGVKVSDDLQETVSAETKEVMDKTEEGTQDVIKKVS